MLTPSLQNPDDRGKRWLQAKTQPILADSAVALATPRAEDAPSCYWGTGPETSTTLYFLLTGDPEPKTLHFHRGMITGCGSGRYATQHNAVLFIRRTLKQRGILPVEHADKGPVCMN